MLESSERCRAMALLCRQQAARDPDNRWRLLGEAEKWEHLAGLRALPDTETEGFVPRVAEAVRNARPLQKS